MKLQLLLDKLKAHRDTEIEERVLPDGTRIFIISSTPPFPLAKEPRWYVLIVRHAQEEIHENELIPMLRHLWHLQILEASENA